MNLESCELRRPVSSNFFKPGLEVGKGRGAEAIDTKSPVLSRLVFFDQLRLAQYAQMAAHGRRTDIERRRKLARAHRPLAQEIDHAPPCRISKCCKNVIDLFGAGKSLAHSRPVTLWPVAASISAKETCRTVWPKVQKWPSRSN